MTVIQVMIVMRVIYKYIYFFKNIALTVLTLNWGGSVVVA